MEAGIKRQQSDEEEETRNKDEVSLKPAFKTLVFRVLAIFIYMCLGALVFCAIEYKKKDKTIWYRKTRLMRSRLMDKYNISTQDMDLYEYLIGRRQLELRDSNHEWSYYQSLYFASTVTTTIGYGHLTPQTQEGRLFLIVFAVVGIPLNILALATVGEHITIGICFGISRLSRICCKTRTVHHINIKVMIVSITLMVFMLFIGGALYVKTETWTYIDSIYYCFVALATIGFGDLVPNDGQAPEKTFEQALWGLRVLYISIGLSLVSTVFTAISNAIEEINALLGWPKKDKNEEETNERTSVSEGLKKGPLRLPSHLTYRTAVDEMHDNLASALPIPGFRSASKDNSEENVVKKLSTRILPTSKDKEENQFLLKRTEQDNQNNIEARIHKKNVSDSSRESVAADVAEKCAASISSRESVAADVAEKCAASISSRESVAADVAEKCAASISSRENTEVVVMFESPSHRRSRVSKQDELVKKKNRDTNTNRSEFRHISIDCIQKTKSSEFRPYVPGKLHSLKSNENNTNKISQCIQSGGSTNFTSSNEIHNSAYTGLDIESQISDFPYKTRRNSQDSTASTSTFPRKIPERIRLYSEPPSYAYTNTSPRRNRISSVPASPNRFTLNGINNKMEEGFPIHRKRISRKNKKRNALRLSLDYANYVSLKIADGNTYNGNE